MPVYEYTALDIKGKTVSGIINAESAGTARQKLRASRNFPVSIKEVHDTAAIKTPSSVSITRYFARVKPNDISMMTRQLSTLVGAGFPLVSALDTLIPQTRSQVFKKYCQRSRTQSWKETALPDLYLCIRELFPRYM